MIKWGLLIALLLAAVQFAGLIFLLLALHGTALVIVIGTLIMLFVSMCILLVLAISELHFKGKGGKR